MKRRKRRRPVNFIEKMDVNAARKYLTFASIAVFLLSLLPILYLSGTDRASGDDWGYGLLTHYAWIESHSLLAVFKAACTTVKNYYGSWQGTWFSVFLFTLQPESFSHEAYWIVPYLMLFLLIAGISCTLYQLFVKTLGASVPDFLLMDSALLLLLIQFVPYKTSSIFWYNGAAHYTVPFALALFSVYFSLRYIQSLRIHNIVWAAVCMTLLGGTNYLAAIFALLILILLVILYYPETNRALLLAIPMALEICGLLVSALAPGNARRGGEDYEVTLERMLWAVLESFKEGLSGIPEMLADYTVPTVAMLIVGVLLWDILKDVVPRRRLHFPLPGVVILYFISTYCAMYWPIVFANVEVSGGVPNTIYWMFMLMLFCSLLYGLGWIAEHRGGKRGNKKTENWLHAGIFAAALMLVLASRSDLKNSTDYVCLQYIRSGQAADYRAQMEQFTQILTDENVKDAVLPMINNEQGPLMHMPLTENPEAWTNQTVKNFFRKNSVVAIPRDEWNARESSARRTEAPHTPYKTNP